MCCFEIVTGRTSDRVGYCTELLADHSGLVRWWKGFSLQSCLLAFGSAGRRGLLASAGGSK